ncbi:MAG TPA: cell division protein FtsL [Deltaproteobacteria bacterium]|nr:cell division protein FtsL [Deltaproteobacteria bacterium]HOM28908.1 cell division protein FtsL [Deltaproteobacteria bacterium]HPP80161.1 cell division protein FtsL [Deltaproteobacteria bacterium]
MTSADLKRMLGPLLVMVSSLAFWASVHVWSRHQVIELGYALSREQARMEQLASQNRALRIEISTLKSPKRLEAIAQKDLGLTPPRPEQVVYLWSNE